MRSITNNHIEEYKKYLLNEEKTPATVQKYVGDILNFISQSDSGQIDKERVLQYKSYLCERYAPASVNSKLSSLNSFFAFHEWFELRVKSVRIQRQVFSSCDKELKKAEYERLLSAAKIQKNERLYLLMQTICSTGIRVSEVRYITVEAVKNKRADIQCKGKRRTVFLPTELCRMLKDYCKAKKITSGCIFITKTGKPLDRSNIWSDMKKLCKSAGVSEKKVFPHNLRHLFARTYYNIQKDIVRLADILGHSNVNTTRIYTMESGEIHRKQIQRLGLLQCWQTE